MKGDIRIPKGDMQNAGRWLMAGALSELVKIALGVIFAVAVITTVLDLTGHVMGFSPADDTDAGWGYHSGLVPRRDALTGCEYLETSDGALTPRLRADGHQVCR